MRGFVAALLLTLSLVQAAWAFEPFVVEDIEVRGLQRVPVGTVFNYLPVRAGQTLDQAQAAEAVRRLYQTGFFQDVEIGREGDVLVIDVSERPAVARLDVVGNELIPTEDLKKGLADAGLAEGRVFNRSLLSDVERDLQRQYLTLGRYNVNVQSTVTPLSRNRVAIRIQVEEGEQAKIREINVVGNEAVSDRTLKRLFEIGPERWYHIFSSRDEYAREKLAAALEALRSYYQDRGYVNFAITSTQVALSPDREGVYITINVDEGKPYRVGEVKLLGDLVVGEDALQSLIETETGALYSRKDLVATAKALTERLGDEGYAFASINPVPEIDEDKGTVDLTYFVDPGKRVYVRRINIRGNDRTKDIVIRRELRQLEGTWLSSSALRRSRQRLERLGFFDAVDIKTPRVPGEPDVVDVDVEVSERLSGSLQLGVGYGQAQGFLVNFAISQDNFLGTGNRLQLTFNNSQVNTVYSASLLERYYTPSGISRRLTASFRETDAREADLSDYSFTTGVLGVSYGVPVSETDTVNFGLNLESLELQLGDDPGAQVRDFVAAQGLEFTSLRMTLGWVGDSRNSPRFPVRGARQELSGEMTLPGSDLEYYKLLYSHSRYYPLTDRVTLSLDGSLGYGEGFGGTEDLPFFENFYAGGVTTVRGYQTNSLGPRDAATNDPLGGNARMLGSAGLIFPVPFTDIPTVRLSTFVDVGNVFDTGDGMSAGDLRASTGVGFMWWSPFGPLTMSLAHPLNAEEDDDLEVFQFSFGNFF